MKIIDFRTIKNLGISPLKCYDWVSEAILRKKEALLPAKISLKPGVPGAFFNTMPVLIPEQHIGGVKIVTRYPERKPSLESDIMLYDLNSGECIALMDGSWITAMRTGAVAAHSIKLLAVKDFSTVSVIGLGNTARASLLVLLELYKERSFTVKLKKYKEQHISFAERFRGYPDVEFLFCETYEECISESDVVISAVTFFDDDICDESCFKPGCTLIPIHTRGFTGCDLTFDKIFADDTAHVSGFGNFSRFRYFAEVSDAAAGIVPGRENDRERIIAYNIGIALHDIWFAGKIYDMCAETSPESDMKRPDEKFWI